MIISNLIKDLMITSQSGPGDVDIKGIAYDSRLVELDYLFVAVKGFSADGHNYIQDAVNRGATVVVAEHPVDIKEVIRAGNQKETAYIGVSDSREALALISSAFYGHPSGRLSLIGITGTNGKTTTSFITKSIIDAGGGNAGLLGTICYITGVRTAAAVNTTPESLDLQRYLSEMLDNNMKHAVLEVSSHALSLKRIKGCSLRVAAFTNFSRDHLDFHRTMDEYFDAKSGIFNYLDSQGTAVLNRDDPRLRTLSEQLACNVITCGIEPGAMIRAENIQSKKSEYRKQRTEHMAGMQHELSFDVCTPESRFQISSSLIGRFNVYNILISIGIAYALGIREDVIKEGVRNARPVEGRFENIDEGQEFLAIVDYAHTDDALQKLIQEARLITTGRIITVFGCGGNRDRSKRPIMGKVASDLSDVVIVTSDNPRSEEPAAIIRDILEGIEKSNFTSMPDREEAIREAVLIAKPGDAVLVAGKGHENYQEVDKVRHHFSDKEILTREIKKRLADSP